MKRIYILKKKHRPHHYRFTGSGTSLRKGENQHSQFRRKPLPLARMEPRVLVNQAMKAPRIAAIKGRTRTVPNVQSHDRSLDRLPFIGLRSQRPDTLFGGRLLNIKLDLNETIKNQLGITKLKHALCRKRKLRRAIMFMKKLAGKGKRKSPGSGGTYKRNETSLISCGG